MAIIKISEGQTLKDIVIEHLGNAELLYEVAILNNIEVTADLIVGQEISLPDVAIDKIRITQSFVERNIKPASALDGLELDQNDWDVFYGLYD